MRPFIMLLFGALLAQCLTVSGLGQPDGNRSFNLMTYNIRMNTPADGANAWPLRKDKVIGLIRFHQADLFGVQEALAVQMGDLKAGFPDFDCYGVGRDDGKEAGEFMAIFSNYIFTNRKATVSRHGVLSDSSGVFYPSDHLPVLAEILLNGPQS